MSFISIIHTVSSPPFKHFPNVSPMSSPPFCEDESQAVPIGTPTIGTRLSSQLSIIIIINNNNNKNATIINTNMTTTNTTTTNSIIITIKTPTIGTRLSSQPPSQKKPA